MDTLISMGTLSTEVAAVLAAGLYGPMSRKLSTHSSPFEITFVMMWVGALW